MTRSTYFLIALAYAAPLAVLACTVHLSALRNVPLHQLLRDPLAVARLPYYVGAISNLGVVCWSASLGVALFLACLRNVAPAARRFFMCFGALTCLLVMDDLYQLHEEVIPKYGGHDQALLGAYGLLAALLLLGNRRFILSHPYGHLVAALAFFATSVAFDAFNPGVPYALGVLIEDGAKLLGIVAWAVFTVVVGVAEVNGRSVLTEAAAPVSGAYAAGTTARRARDRRRKRIIG